MLISFWKKYCPIFTLTSKSIFSDVAQIKYIHVWNMHWFCYLFIKSYRLIEHFKHLSLVLIMKVRNKNKRQQVFIYLYVHVKFAIVFYASNFEDNKW